MKKLPGLFLLLSLMFGLGACMPTETPTPVLATFTAVPTATMPPPTDTPLPPTDTPLPPTATPLPPTDTPISPTDTPVPPTNTPIPPTATPLPPLPTPAFFEQLDEPWHLIGSYVNAINRGEYSRAYGYWETPTQTLAQFRAGFADTQSVVAVVQPPIAWNGAAGSQYTTIATALLATHTDGSRHNFVGCYVLRRTNPAMVGHPTPWSIQNAQMRVVNKARLNARLLADACTDLEPATPLVPYDNRDDAIGLLTSYYNAINLHDYARAYSYWETPPQDYDTFVAGFADTDSVLLAVKVPIFVEGAAGSRYTSIPALLLATHTDASKHNFLGCFVAHSVNPALSPGGAPWGLANARVAATPHNRADAWQLGGACP